MSRPRKYSERSGKRLSKGPSARWPWVAVVIVGAALSGLFLVKRSGPAPADASAPSTNSGQGPVASDQPLPDAEQEQALRKEQLQAADKLAAEFPDNDDAVYLAGSVRNEQGDSETAMKFWTRALALDATRADANESLGYAFLLRDEYHKAEAHLRRALELDPKLDTARLRLAAVLSDQGKMEEVVTVLSRADSSSAEAHRLLGEAYQQLKEYRKAKANYQAALQLKPDLAEAYYGLSKVSAQLGESDQSKKHLDKFSTLKKEADESGRRWRAGFSPLKVAKESVAQTHTDVGRVYLRQGRLREAEALWLRAAALSSSNTICRLQLAVHYQRTDRGREALRCYEEIARIDPEDGLVHLNLGRVCLKLKQMDRAEQAFKEVIRLAPEQPEGPSALAEVYLQQNKNLAEAKRLAETAVSLAPQGPHFALLGQACAMNGDRGGALAAFNRAIELEPENHQYQHMRATLLGIR